jgi:hypothetical protein
MKLIEDIRNKIGRWQLDKEIRPKRTNRKLIPFNQMAYVGIVYDAGNAENEQAVMAYTNELRGQGKKVFMLGFVNEKELPSTKKFVLHSEFFWKAKLTAFNLPDKGQIGQFLQQEFDLLLSIFTEPQLPLLAIAAYSQAKYKVGPYMEDGVKLYDFMMDIKPRTDAAFLIEQMDFYLHNIV